MVRSQTFKPFSGQISDAVFLPQDITLKIPNSTEVPEDKRHYLAYIPWRDDLLRQIPEEYVGFFEYVLPYLHARTTDVHIAVCMPFVQLLSHQFQASIDLKVIYIAFILHDVGWSRLSEKEVAASLGVAGLSLNATAAGPKEKHAQIGHQLAGELLAGYSFHPPLTPAQQHTILDAVLFHDKPWEIATNAEIPLEVKLVCDVDHLWSFTHENFWQDTVRKGIPPSEYLQNIGNDIDSYFITDQAKNIARSMLAERKAEVTQYPKQP